MSGTTIGAGMLALPVMTATAGFFPSLLLFFFCWLTMLTSAFFFLDVNLAVSGEPNFISMAGKMLGVWGKGVSWIVYLLLLYALLAAYIAGSTPLFIDGIFALTGYVMPAWVAPFSLPLIFGSFIYLGTRGVDYINRLLMLCLGIGYVLLVMFVPQHIQSQYLLYHHWASTLFALPVVATAFGYHIIIPSLTTYLDHNAKQLRWAIIIGSVLPLIVYFIWQWLVLGTVPLTQLIAAFQGGQSATEPLAQIINNPWIGLGARIFSFFAIVTSFLGISLSLSDFLTDGLKIKKSWEGKLLAYGLTFIPPLFFVFTYQRGFYLALQHGGALVAILLIFLPALMAWKLKSVRFYQSWKGRALLVLIMLCALGIVVVDLLNV